MITEYMEQQIKLNWLKFKTKYEEIPPIDETILMEETSESFAKVLSKDLYNRRYILYVCGEMFEFPNESIESILFHEFMHIRDSVQFLEYNFDDFCDIMTSYSEFHGASVSMKSMIEQCKTKPITIKSDIMHNNGILTIESFIEQDFKRVKDNIKLISSNNNNSIFFETEGLYYFMGYLKCLKDFNINYIFRFYEIAPANYLLWIKDTYDVFMKDKVSYKEVLIMQRKFIQTVKTDFNFNNIRNMI